MSGISISITGMPELKRKLAQLSDAVAGEKLENAVVAGALLVQNAAKDNAPWISGNLRRSIHIGGHAVLVNTTGTDIGGNKHTATSAEVLVGTNVDYAFAVEYGLPPRPAKPYLRPALDEHRDAVAQEVGEALADLLRGVTG